MRSRAVAALCLAVLVAVVVPTGAVPGAATSGPGDASPVPSTAAATAPVANATRPDPSSDRLGWEGGYWYDDPVAVTPGDGLNDTELAAVVNRSMARVERVRRLEFREPVPVAVVSRATYRNRSVGRNLTTAERLAVQGRFEALFFAGETTDAVALRRALYAGSVQGYYSPREDRVVVVSENATAPRVDEVTLAQELFHALQAQAFDAYDRPWYPGATREAHNAADGLIEGDGNLVDHRYAERCRANWSCLLPDEDGSGVDVHPGLLFLVYQPYSDGPPFVESVRERGGWAAVNDLYDDPPASTEQTIHPAKYGVDAPANLTLADRSGERWRSVGTDSFGEAGLRTTFVYPAFERGQAALDSVSTLAFLTPDADPALDAYDYGHRYSAGWDGDRLRVYATNGSARTGETGYVWTSVWDSPAEAREFRTGYERLLVARGAAAAVDADGVYRIDAGPYADAFALRSNGSRVTVVNAPTVEALSAVDGRVPDLAGVRTVPDVDGDGRAATDPDGDGRFEDVDGDGRLAVRDAAVLLRSFDGPAVEAVPSAFDFTGDGAVNVLDVAELLDEV